MVAYLIDYFLTQNKSVAVLSRGYGRKTKGFRICNGTDTPETVGDEPFSNYLRYGDSIIVAVGEDRALSIPFILAENEKVDLIVLDDAFQHRSVLPHFQVLLTTQQRPFWKDFVLPAGLLREARKGYTRADAIVITKSEKMDKLNWMEKPYFHTKVVYKEPVIFFGKKVSREVIVVAGLADNSMFFEYCSVHYDVRKYFDFNDHHSYKKTDIDSFIEVLNHDSTLITTEKDAVKLMQYKADLKGCSCAYIPIGVSFLENEERFLQIMNQSLGMKD